MTLLLSLDGNRRASVSGEQTARATPIPPKPANEGHGDVRKKIVPIVKAPEGPSATEWEGGVYRSLADWLNTANAEGAILVQPADDPRALAGRLDDVALIAVDFPRIGDGRGYSIATLLRQRLGYKGPLRAIGAITADQVFALARVGFDSFALRADQGVEPALQALNTYTTPYQGADGALGNRDAANFAARVRLLENALTQIAAKHERAALASSLSAEDMVVTDVIARLGLKIDVFTLDTGRLHSETLDLIETTRRRYGLNIAVFKPDQSAVDGYVAAQGRNAFYESIELRKLCCTIRKVEPLNRALADRDAWITGQRRAQAITRGALPEAEHDAERGMEKYNPLAEWAWDDVLAYAARYDIPMNALYARNYVSIGCEPCTKAIRPGEDPRTGRWWWEQEEKKECGLHTTSTIAR